MSRYIRRTILRGRPLVCFDPGAVKPARLDSKVIPYNERVELPSGGRLMLGNVVIEITSG